MKSKNNSSPSLPFRPPGQRSISSTSLFKPPLSCSNNNSDAVTSDNKKKNPGSNLSLTSFLNSKLHKTSVLPIDKDENACLEVNHHDSLNASNSRDELCDSEGRRDESGCVVEDSVFKLFNDSGGSVRKRPSECLTATSRFEGGSKKQSQNHLVVLGDDPKPKRRVHKGFSCSNKKPRPLYNHYKNGTGFWEPEREGVDSDEVGSTEIWEGKGSSTVGGLNWH